MLGERGGLHAYYNVYIMYEYDFNVVLPTMRILLINTAVALSRQMQIWTRALQVVERSEQLQNDTSAN